jgi:glycosyltransferase involved in cell wall biosynthesis
MNAAGPRLNLGYHDVAHTGYGTFGKELHEALKRAGVEDYGPTSNPDLRRDLKELRRDGFKLNDPIVGPQRFKGDDYGDYEKDPNRVSPVALYAATPPHVLGWYEGQVGVLFSMWEFSEIPAGFRTNVPDFDRLLVPSIQNQELFSQYHPDVRYVPLAAGREWHYRERPGFDDGFVFLTGGAGSRKGCDDVVRAFDKVFAKWQPSWGPEPKLIVRAQPHINHHDFQAPRVTVLPKPVADLPGLYGQAHCFVSGSKGEGWGLMPFQAICQGIPTILGDAHGHAAFADLGIPLSVHPRDAGVPTHWGSSGQEWVPDFDEMCERMKEVYANYNPWRRYAALCSGHAWDRFSWDDTAQNVIECVPEMMGPDIKPGPWRRMPQRLFLCRVNRHETWSVNGRLATFDPGYDYQEPWSTKVRLAETGNLHPSCIDVREKGILDEGGFRGGPTRCPHCSQLYGVDHSLYPENLVKD